MIRYWIAGGFTFLVAEGVIAALSGLWASDFDEPFWETYLTVNLIIIGIAMVIGIVWAMFLTWDWAVR